MPLLHWLTREEDIHRAALAPYRLLEEALDLSHGDRKAGSYSQIWCMGGLDQAASFC